MRFGLNWAPIRNQQELEAALPLIDELGLAATAAPAEMNRWPLHECAAYGDMVRSYGLIIGEVGYWQNLLVDDEAARSHRIDEVRSLLQKADAMGAGCVVTLVGSFDSKHALAPHAENWSDRARERAAENCHRILDGLDLQRTCYALEPWCNGFYHEAEAVAGFLEKIDHPRLALHLDVMNMHSVNTYYQSTQVIEQAFDLLGKWAVSVHAKDLRWDPTYMFLRMDEVMPGEGILDYDLFLRRVDSLSPDIPVYTEHWHTDEQYMEAIGRLHALAASAGIRARSRN